MIPDHPDRLSIASKCEILAAMAAKPDCNLHDLKGCLETTLAHVNEEMQKPSPHNLIPGTDAQLVDAILYSGKGAGL